MSQRHWTLTVFPAIWLGLAISAAIPARAGEVAEPPLRVEREITTYTVSDDGSYVETHETAIKVIKEAGLEAAKDASITHSTSVQQAEVISAYTLKPDGRKVKVPPGNFQINSRAGQNGDSPIYSDLTTLTVVFPELAVGDTTVLSYRMTATRPMFDGQFSVIQSYSPATYYGNVRVTIDTPADMAVQQQAWQMQQTVRSAGKGRKLVEWTWSNRKPVDPESLRDSVFKVERYPGYAFSTFTSYAQIAKAYGDKATAKAAPTPRIRALADEIAGDATQPRDIAKHLYEWVARNITYAGNCIGIGAVVPRDLDVVLDNKMGDCKDHATLLQALLKAKGIDSTQALVNAGGSYTLPKVPVASVVNHVINYIPSLDLYLDSTAATVPFGSLPASAAGKPVLLVDGFRDDAMTPAVQAGHDRQRMTTTLRISPDGSVKGTQQLELGGRLAVATRDQFRNMDPADADKLVKRYFQATALKAEGSVEYDDPKPLLDQFKLGASFDVQRMLPVPGGIAIAPLFFSLSPVSGIVMRNVGSDDQPEGESSCGGVLSEEEYVYEFPDSVRIVAMPADFSAQNDDVSYVATYRRAGNRVLVKRTLDDRTPGPVCSAEYNTSYAQLMRKIMPNVRAQIIYLTQDAAH